MKTTSIFLYWKSINILFGIILFLSACKKDSETGDSVLPPVANFTVVTNTPDIARSVMFIDKSENYPTSWLWTFGDGVKSTLQNPTTVYRKIGSFPVSLTVTNSAGSDTKTVQNFITIGQIDSVADFEGNVYLTIKIGNQWWMAENLKSTRYNDGSPIPEVKDSIVWASLSTPAFCWFNNDISNKEVCGALYNWHVVNTGKLAPVGWHVPNDDEWKELEMALGMTQKQADSAGFRGLNESLKLRSSIGWPDWGSTGNNSSGFSAVPAGDRLLDGTFRGKAHSTSWWTTSTEPVFQYPWYRSVFSLPGHVIARIYYPPKAGLSVRCVKNK